MNMVISDSRFRPLYFDNQATTPVDPRVVEAMMPYFTEKFGNADSVGHSYGWEAKMAVSRARELTARLIGAETKEIIFTSGATESINLAILGALELLEPGRHLISCVTEHKATLETLKRAEKLGHQVTLLKVDRQGHFAMEELHKALRQNTALISLMHANNEIGTLHPIQDVGRLCRERDILFHVDAAQTVGKHAINVKDIGADLLSLSGHKFYAPKGIGALYIRNGVRLCPILTGGAHESGLRPGTMNVPAIVGLGRACEIAQESMAHEGTRLHALCKRLRDGIREIDSKAELNGDPEHRLCSNLNFTFRGIDPDLFLMGMSHVAFSTASACSGTGKSYVLEAIGQSQNDASVSNVRLGLGRFTTEAEVVELLSLLAKALKRAREA